MRGVKKMISMACLVAAAAVAVGCAPKTTDPEQLRVVHEQNAQLVQEIARMQALIEQAGEDVPNLQEQISAKEAEVASAIKELDDLHRRESEMKLRGIELRDRLDDFRDAFRKMQNEISRK